MRLDRGALPKEGTGVVIVIFSDVRSPRSNHTAGLSAQVLSRNMQVLFVSSSGCVHNPSPA
jgi:hypothetical protein